MAERNSPACRSLLRGGLALQLALALIGSAIYVAVASAAGTTAPTPSVGHGKQIFEMRCIVCHNKRPGDTSPFGPPNLFSAFKGPKAISAVQAETIVTNGKTPMPAFGTVLSRNDIHSVVAYLRVQAEMVK